MINLKPFTLYLTYEPDDLNRICKKLLEYDSTADGETFYRYMRSGLLNRKVFPFIAYDTEGKMMCTFVINITQAITQKERKLFIQGVWIDPHYPKFWKKGMKILEEACKTFGIRKMVAYTRRTPEAFQRKFGFKQVDAVIEKEIKEVSSDEQRNKQGI